MKKIITIALLAVSFLVWRMGAMQQEAAAAEPDQIILKTSDNKEISMSQADAKFFRMILEGIDILGSGKPISLPNVTEIVLRRLIADMPWVKRVLLERQANETEEQSAERAARAFPKSDFSVDGIRNVLENLKAADYLGCLELRERYARIIAGMLISEGSLVLLYKNDPAYYCIDSRNRAAGRVW